MPSVRHIHHRFQSYAFNRDRQLVKVSPTCKNDGNNYVCPYCGHEMIAKCGNIRQWHFAHKSNTEYCSYDNYLHAIAEKKICDWFNNSESIILGLETEIRCSKYETCQFYNNEDEVCSAKQISCHNLKQYYNQSEVEYTFKNYRADILCHNTKKEADPLFLEIFVTHKCSDEKIDSGIRIIEFKIESEEDIESIVESSVITEGPKIKLYNFKRKISYSDSFSMQLQKFILFRSRKAFLDIKSFSCKNFETTHKGIYEVTTPYDDCLQVFWEFGGLYVVGKVLAFRDKFLVRDCSLCKWMRRDNEGVSICVLYKKCGNSKYCNENDAARCSMFRQNSELIKSVLSAFDNNENDVAVNIWQLDKKEI